MIYGTFVVFFIPTVCRTVFFLAMQCTLHSVRRCVHRRHVFCSHGHVSVHVVLGGLPDALNGESVSVSSSTPWTAVSKSWSQSHQIGGNVGNRRGWPQSQSMLLCRRTSQWPRSQNMLSCTRQQKPLVTNQRQPAVVLATVLVTTSQPSPEQSGARRTCRLRRYHPQGGSRAAVLVLADIVSRVCSRVCCGAGVLAELLNAHLESLGVGYRFSTRQSRKFMRSLGYSFKKPKGELWKEWPEAETRTLRGLCQQEDRVDIERCWHRQSQPHHQHRRDVLQDVAPARTRVGSLEANRTSSWTRAARSPCSSPPGIAFPTCMPNSSFRARPPPWSPPTTINGCSPRPARRATGRRP